MGYVNCGGVCLFTDTSARCKMTVSSESDRFSILHRCPSKFRINRRLQMLSNLLCLCRSFTGWYGRKLTNHALTRWKKKKIACLCNLSSYQNICFYNFLYPLSKAKTTVCGRQLSLSYEEGVQFIKSSTDQFWCSRSFIKPLTSSSSFRD